MWWLVARPIVSTEGRPHTHEATNWGTAARLRSVSSVVSNSHAGGTGFLTQCLLSATSILGVMVDYQLTRTNKVVAQAFVLNLFITQKLESLLLILMLNSKREAPVSDT